MTTFRSEVIAIAAVMLLGCGKPGKPVGVKRCYDIDQPAARQFIIDCAKAANPMSDEERRMGQMQARRVQVTEPRYWRISHGSTSVVREGKTAWYAWQDAYPEIDASFGLCECERLEGPLDVLGATRERARANERVLEHVPAEFVKDAIKRRELERAGRSDAE